MGIRKITIIAITIITLTPALLETIDLSIGKIINISSLSGHSGQSRFTLMWYTATICT